VASGDMDLCFIFDSAANADRDIGCDITVTILEIRGRQVRIGVSAPRGITVLREEIVEEGEGSPNARCRSLTQFLKASGRGLYK